MNRVRKYLYGKTTNEVKDKLSAVQRQVIVSGDIPNPGNRTVNDLLTAWLHSVTPTLKPWTLADHEAIATRHIRPYIGKIRLSRLAPEHIQTLYTQLQAPGTRRALSHAHPMRHQDQQAADLMQAVLGGIAPGAARSSCSRRDGVQRPVQCTGGEGCLETMAESSPGIPSETASTDSRP